MGTLEHDEWMTDSDAVLWHIERDPLLRSTITAVWFLDTSPDETRLDANLRRMTAAIPRLRQHVIDAQPGVAPPRWSFDPYFDLDYHVRSVRLDADDPERAVLEHAERLASRAFDRDRPLWELDIIEGIAGGGGAFVMKIHHAIADGIGMIRMLGHIVALGPDDDAIIDADERERDAEPVDQLEGVDRAGGSPSDGGSDDGLLAASRRAVTRRLVTDAGTVARLGAGTLRRTSVFVRDPFGSLGRARRTTASVARMIEPAGTPRSPLMTGRSLSLRMNAFDVPIEPIRDAVKRVDGTLNDGFVTAVVEGLHRYHTAHDTRADDVRMHMPVSIRAGAGPGADTLSNQFVPARFLLSLAEMPLEERLRTTKARLREVRAEPALTYANDVAGIVERFGPVATVTLIGSMMKGVDVTASNVPGPPFPVFLAGSRIERLYAFGPLAGSALNVTLVSYDGALRVGVTTDRAAVGDVDLMLTCLRTAFDDIAHVR